MAIIQDKISCQVQNLGVIGYQQAYAIQMQSVNDVLNGKDQTLIMCEHPPVLTLGRLAKECHILTSKEEVVRQGVKIHHIDRGGDITLHAPGQLIIYPILNLTHYGKDLHRYMRRLEQVAIDLLGEFDILASRSAGLTGVWTGSKKIASIGIGVRKWVSFHGLAINVNTDLKLFSMIKPCGLDVQMTSMSEVCERVISMEDVKNKMIDHFSKHFQLDCMEVG